MDEGDKVMRSGPPRIVQAILSFLVPPPCREEVLGDLYESCESSLQFILEAFRVLPMIIFSRVRRTADPPVLMMQAVVLYLSFLGAGWYTPNTLPFTDSGLLRLAIPAAWVVIGLILDDAYGLPGRQSVFKKLCGLALGLGLAYLSQMALSTVTRLALPSGVMLFGSVSGLLFSTGLKYLFPAAMDRPARAAGPAFWLKYTPESFRIAPEVISIAKTLAFVLALAFLGGQVGGRLLAMALVFASILLLIVRELRSRW